MARGSVAPPRTVAVYVVESDSDDDGWSVAVRVAGSYVTTAGTIRLDGSRSWKVLDPIVAASIASLNVAVTFESMPTEVAPFAGETAVTVGGVVSGAMEVTNTRSTQSFSD